MGALLLDDRSDPPLREVLARLLRCGREADIAIARIRLAGMDLSQGELGGLQRCRVLIGRIDAETFADTADIVAREPGRAEVLQHLVAFLSSGRLEVRASGRDAWLPDFSVIRGLRDGDGTAEHAATVVGPHYFARPYPSGPALTCVVGGNAAARIASTRFEELWSNAYDIAPVVREEVERVLAGSELAP